MFKVGSTVSYSTTGICTISDIITETIGGKERKYFCLLPMDKQSSRVLVPVDNKKLTDKMRKVPAKEELEELILRADGICMPWQENDAKRSEAFALVIESGKPEGLLSVIGCLIRRRNELVGTQRHLKTSDNTALKTAERILGSSVAFSFCISFDEAVKKIENAFS